MTRPPEGPRLDTRTRLPDFFIVGQSKSGTTALHQMLGSHPQIYMPAFKEPTYFAADLRPRVAQRIPEPETLAEYLELFEPAAEGQLIGEASSLYLYSRAAAGAIADVAPQAKIIAILREPASFLASLHLQLVQNRLEDQKDLARALALEGERARGRRIPPSCYRPQALLYSERVRYTEQLRRYHEQFPPEQVLVLIYEDFRSDNEAAVRSVLRFLEVDEDVALAHSEANPSVAVRSVRLDGLRHRLGGGANAPLPSDPGGVLPRSRARGLLGRWARAVLYRTPPQPDERLMRELRVRFKPEVVELGEFLHRDLVTLWGYDGVE